MEKNFALHRSLEEHIHYVMMISLNPRDLSTFCSGSIDKTIKVWNL
jgi:coatomer subunit beta'